VRELPAGTVTFLFTDIEGSTRLLHELGAEEYANQVAEHRRVLREAFEHHGGVEVDTQGDAFFVAYEIISTPSSALLSTPGRRSLWPWARSERWPTPCSGIFSSLRGVDPS
jgi:hypothetical protein